jgi:hypothetical protein
LQLGQRAKVCGVTIVMSSWIAGREIAAKLD